MGLGRRSRWTEGAGMVMLCSLCAVPSGTAFIPMAVEDGRLQFGRGLSICKQHHVLSKPNFVAGSKGRSALWQGLGLDSARRGRIGREESRIVVDADTDSGLSDGTSRSNLLSLYISQFSLSLGDRMWEFAVPFFILALNRADSMSFAVFYAVFLGFANVAGAPIVGYFTEKYSRMRTISFCVVILAVSVLTSLVVMDLALSLSFPSGAVIQGLIFVLIVTCSVASLSSFARDWVRCLNDDDEARIERCERLVRRIRIGSRGAAPPAVITILAFVPPKAAAAGIALLVCLAHVINYNILRNLFITVPRLAAPAPKRRRRPGPGLLSPTQTLVRVRGRSRWLLAYKAAWRDFFDIDGDGVLTRGEISCVIRSGFVRCWDLWVGVVFAAGCYYYVRNILVLPLI